MAIGRDESGERPRTGSAAPDAQRQLAERDLRIADLEQVIVELTAQVELLTQSLDRNSSNSHLPPSSDGPGAVARGIRPGKAAANKAKATGNKKRKRGGQKGHRGAHRKLLAPERVDDVIHLYAGACEACAYELPRRPGPNPRRHQRIDLRGSGLHVTQWQREQGKCDRCGHRTLAAYDPSVIPSSPFGPRLVAVVVMLTGVYHLSRRQAANLMNDLFGVSMSPGTVSAMEARATKDLRVAYEEVEREVEGAPVKHTDGTSWLLGGLLMSLWVLAGKTATLYKIFSDGQRETIKPWFGRLVGILVSDRASVFGFWAMAARQICWAHLVRKMVSFSQRDGPAGAHGRELLALTGLVFEYWHGFKAGQLDRQRLQELMHVVCDQFETALQRAVASGISGLSGSCANMLKHRAALWTYLKHEGVEPTNNHAELALRPLVLWRRRSFGCQSKRGLRFVERVMTVAATARKQGKDVLGFLEGCVTARVNGTTPPSLIEFAAAA